MWQVFPHRHHLNNKPAVSQSCAVAKSEKFWWATGQSNLVHKRLPATNVSKVWFSYSHNCTLANGTVFTSVWFSSGPPECFSFSYCAWLWNWLMPQSPHNLTTIWRQSDDNLTTIWRQSNDNLATIWRQSDDNLATIWRQSNDNLATIWRQSGDNLTTIWRQSDDDIACQMNHQRNPYLSSDLYIQCSWFVVSWICYIGCVGCVPIMQKLGKLKGLRKVFDIVAPTVRIRLWSVIIFL